MTTVRWLVFAALFLILFHSNPFVPLFDEPSWTLPFHLPLCHPRPLLFIPDSPRRKACSLKDKIEHTHTKKKWGCTQTFRRDNVLMVQGGCNIKVFACGSSSSDKNESAQGSLRYQRPLSAVVCWGHGEWSLTLFLLSAFLCSSANELLIQINELQPIVSPLFWFLAAPLPMFAPSKSIWKGHTTLQSNLVCLSISTTDGLPVAELLWPWGDGEVRRHRVDKDYYWYNREGYTQQPYVRLNVFFSPLATFHYRAANASGWDRTDEAVRGIRDVVECLWRVDREEKRNRDKKRKEKKISGKKLRKDWRRRRGGGKVRWNPERERRVNEGREWRETLS